MTLIDSLEHYYGALDENDRPRQQESPQPVEDGFEKLFDNDPDFEDLEDDVDYGQTDDELEES